MLFAEKHPALLEMLKPVLLIGHAATADALIASNLTVPMGVALTENASLKYVRISVSENWDAFRHQVHFPDPEAVREIRVWRYAVSNSDLDRL